MRERLVIRAHRPGRLWRQLMLVAGVAVVVGTGLYLLGSHHAGVAYAEAEARAETLGSELERLQTEEARLRAQLAVLERGAQVDQQAVAVIQDELRALQASNLELRGAVAFYQGIVSPQARGDGLQVQAMMISGNPQTGAYHYRLVLTQVTKIQSRIRGSLQIQVIGAEGGRPASYALADLSPDKADKLAFRFRYYQEIEGDWVLPPGFMPQTVRVTLSPHKRDKVERSLAWDELLRGGTA